MRLRIAARIVISSVLAVALLAGTVAFARSPRVPVFHDLTTTVPDLDLQLRPPDPRPIRTFFELSGGMSYYPTDRLGCMAVRDGANWSAFWAVHMAGVSPRPPVPTVDFTEAIALVCIFGIEASAEAVVNITAVERDGDGYIVTVYSHCQTGIVPMVTNVWHIKVVTRTDGPVHFHSRVPWGLLIPEIPPVP